MMEHGLESIFKTTKFLNHVQISDVYGCKPTFVLTVVVVGMLFSPCSVRLFFFVWRVERGMRMNRFVAMDEPALAIQPDNGLRVPRTDLCVRVESFSTLRLRNNITGELRIVIILHRDREEMKDQRLSRCPFN
jgi:hypothetical protein